MKRVDLHIHTIFSDGSLSPKEVVDTAIKNNVNTISITDHDNIDAYNEELFFYAKSNNIKLISGIEISTKTKKCGIHVLGYNFDINNVQFKEALVSLTNIRHDYLHEVNDKLNSLGYVLNLEELDKIESVTKAHIALDIINNPLNTELLITNFGKIPSKGDFIESLMIEGCIAYVEKRTITPKEASDLIKNAGGKVFLAHPVSYTYEDNLSDDEIIDIAKEMNADGIEAYCLYVDRNNKKINDIQKWRTKAFENNFLKSIGSDFHVSDGLRQEIGLDLNEMGIIDEELDEIINNIEG